MRWWQFNESKVPKFDQLILKDFTGGLIVSYLIRLYYLFFVFFFLFA